MITHVSKESNLEPGDKIRYIWSPKGPILLVRLFSKKTSMYCHSPGIGGGGVVVDGVVRKL